MLNKRDMIILSSIMLMSALHASPVSSAPESVSTVQQTAQLTIPDLTITSAYQQYSLRPKSELSKLIFLIDLYRNSDVQVVYDGVENTSEVALGYARKYISDNYRKENAEAWIKEHAYRAKSGQIIYVKLVSGQVVPLRDLLLEQLHRLG